MTDVRAGVLEPGKQSVSQHSTSMASSSQSLKAFDVQPADASVTDVRGSSNSPVSPVIPSTMEVGNPGVSQDNTPSVPIVPKPSVIPPSVPSGNKLGSIPLTGARIFLDICCGVNSPLSNAVQQMHGDTMRFDILVHDGGNLLNSESYEQLLRLCASGLVA